MAKAFGTINKNDKKTSNKQPDLKGFVKIGGYKGENSDDKNRETAEWLKNIASEYSNAGTVFINIAMWKRIDKESGKPYFSVCFEDNSWKTKTSTGVPMPPKSQSVEEDPFGDDFNL